MFIQVDKFPLRGWRKYASPAESLSFGVLEESLEGTARPRFRIHSSIARFRSLMRSIHPSSSSHVIALKNVSIAAHYLTRRFMAFLCCRRFGVLISRIHLSRRSFPRRTFFSTTISPILSLCSFRVKKRIGIVIFLRLRFVPNSWGARAERAGLGSGQQTSNNETMDSDGNCKTELSAKP